MWILVAHWKSRLDYLASFRPMRDLVSKKKPKRMDNTLETTLKVVLWSPHICTHVYIDTYIYILYSYYINTCSYNIKYNII